MIEEEEYSFRSGAGIKWKIVSSHDVISGFTIDNLDTKTLEEAESNYELVFVTVRTALESLESCCMDSVEDRLRVCQEVTDLIKKNRLIKREE